MVLEIKTDSDNIRFITRCHLSPVAHLRLLMSGLSTRGFTPYGNVWL